MKYTIIPVTALQQNCSLIWCEESHKGAVIDPGGDLEKILHAAVSNSVTIEKILITHAHFDHAGGAHELAEKLSIPIEGPHIADQPIVERMGIQASSYGFQPVPSFTPNRWLQQDDTITVGNLTLQVLHCPGHTPGHVIFFHPESKLAFVGDVIFQGSIGRTDFPLSNHADLIHSIRQKLWPLGRDVTFIPGHGPNSTFGAEQSSNPFVGDDY
ncbi:MAG: MBL fold metallo-hydrolase [Candidatus Polarisedimenticolaceae bacterium]|nr:MBL fold metallo-hydrolase [Candidatus Polarisedimenticolaceae bacterium]